MQRWTMTVVVVLVAAACGGGAAETAPPASAETATAGSSSASLSFDDALSRAEAAYPDAPAFEVEYETHEGARVLEVEMMTTTGVHEVYYDLASGAAVHESDETPDADETAAFPALRAQISAGAISMRRALELASSQYPAGSVEAVEFAVEGGRVVTAIVAREASGATRHVHDAASGEHLSSAPAHGEHDEATE